VKALVDAITSTVNATETDPTIILPALSLLAARCAAENLNQKGRKQFIENITKGVERFVSED